MDDRRSARSDWRCADHDIKGSLGIATGYAQLLLARDDPTLLREAAEQIVRATARVSSGVDNLVTLLALAEGDLVPRLRAVSLRASLTAVLAREDGAAEPPSSVSVSVSDSDSDAVVQADPDLLPRVLSAVVASARRCARGASVGLAVDVAGRFGTVSCERGMCSESVVDDSLPLSLARRLAEAHGGFLEVNGQRLTLALPLANHDAVGPSYRVLVVDDDQATRSILRSTLGVSPYEVLEAQDGDEALRLAAAYEPDVVLLDWRLPGSSGSEVLRALRRSGTDTAVIVLTAVTDERERRLAADLGADMFLTKPFSPLELLDALERLAGRRGS